MPNLSLILLPLLDFEIGVLKGRDDIYHVIIDSSFNCRDYPLIMVNYHCWQGTKKILGLPKPLMKVVEKHKKLTFNLKTA